MSVGSALCSALLCSACFALLDCGVKFDNKPPKLVAPALVAVAAVFPLAISSCIIDALKARVHSSTAGILVALANSKFNCGRSVKELFQQILAKGLGHRDLGLECGTAIKHFSVVLNVTSFFFCFIFHIKTASDDINA